MGKRQLFTIIIINLALFLASAWVLAAPAPIENGDEGARCDTRHCPAALGPSLQVTASLTSAKDNTLIEDAEGDLSNGAGPHFFAGKVGGSGGGGIRRGVIAFDLANSAIPPGSTILSVTLKLHLSLTQPGTQTVAVYPVLADWGEGGSFTTGGGGAGAEAGDATWLHRFYSGTLWLTPGGEFSATASTSRPVGGSGFYSWGPTPQLAADVQRWLDEPATNYGWLIQGNEAATQTVKGFDSREHDVVANRPQLIVEFSPPQIYLPLLLKVGVNF